MNIKIVNDKIFFKCLLSKYSPQYDSFKWKNLNQKNFLVNKVPKEVCHHSFGQDNIFCSFMLIILLSLTTSPPQYFFVILKIWKEGQRVKVLKLFDLSYGFRATDGKIAIFWHNQPWKSPKPWIGSKSFRSMTSPKVGFLRLNNILGPKNFFGGPTKPQKIYFLKKLEFRDLSEHWRWFPQWPWSPGYHQTS